MKKHINDLGSTKITLDGAPVTKILDIRVQPGGAQSASKLIEYGEKNNVIVVIKEFGA